MNSGAFAPMRISLTPRLNKPKRMATAFCSNQDKTILTGKSLTLHSKASAKAKAIFTAEIELLHCPKSI